MLHWTVNFLDRQLSTAYMNVGKKEAIDRLVEDRADILTQLETNQSQRTADGKDET